MKVKLFEILLLFALGLLCWPCQIVRAYPIVDLLYFGLNVGPGSWLHFDGRGVDGSRYFESAEFCRSESKES